LTLFFVYQKFEAVKGCQEMVGGRELKEQLARLPKIHYFE